MDGRVPVAVAWTRRQCGFLVAVLVGGIAVGATPLPKASSDMAAPWFILLHGEGVDAQIVMRDWSENARFMESLRPIQTEESPLEGQRTIGVAMFWGPEWAEYPKTPESLAQLTPDQGNQHGRLYARAATLPPVLVMGRMVINDPGLGRIESGNGNAAFAVGSGGVALLRDYNVSMRFR